MYYMFILSAAGEACGAVLKTFGSPLLTPCRFVLF